MYLPHHTHNPAHCSDYHLHYLTGTAHPQITRHLFQPSKNFASGFWHSFRGGPRAGSSGHVNKAILYQILTLLLQYVGQPYTDRTVTTLLGRT